MPLSLVNISLLKINGDFSISFSFGFAYSLALSNSISSNWLKLANANINILLVYIPIIPNISLLIDIINRQGSKLNITI